MLISHKLFLDYYCYSFWSQSEVNAVVAFYVTEFIEILAHRRAQQGRYKAAQTQAFKHNLLSFCMKLSVTCHAML